MSKFGLFRAKEGISAKGASAELAGKLGISEGDPILVRKPFPYSSASS